MTRFSDIPDVEHYAIIEEKTVQTQGDDPRNNKPDYDYREGEMLAYVSYRVFRRHQRKEWEAEVEKLVNKPFVKFKALHVRPAEITTKTVISVKVD